MRRRVLDRVPSQYRRTKQDLAQLDKGALAPREIREAREHTERELQRQLEIAHSVLNVEKVIAFVFECDALMARTFLSLMLTAFDCEAEALDVERLYLIQDAWDFFPHRFLQGRCPAEVMTALFEDELLQG